MLNTSQTNAPLLRRNANVHFLNPNLVTINYLDEEMTLEGNGAVLFGKIAAQLDGKKNISEIADLTGERADRIQDLTDCLKEAGVVADNLADKSMTGLEFYKVHQKYASYWLRPVYEHPLWEKMMTGKATRAQVLGFAFEKYHYIEGAHEHMAIAAANATPEMMPHLARHFIEEYSHGDIYRKGLRSLFSDAQILNSQPLPSTRALVNFLSESAAANSFSYYAGNEVLQMTENTGDDAASGSIDEFYATMRRHYPYTDKLIDSFIAHTRADQSLGHENVFLEMCESVPYLSAKEVKHALNVAKSMAEHLLLFMDGIEACYDKNPTVPRVTCELLSE